MIVETENTVETTAENPAAAAEPAAAEPKAPPKVVVPTVAKPANAGRKTIRTIGRKNRKMKLKMDKEFAKTYFEAKSKRSTDKKSAFRKKKKNKK